MGVWMRYVRPGRVLETSAIGIVAARRGALRRPLGGRQPDARAAVHAHRRCSSAIAIMIYGFAASVLPVWLLLAPRDYLSAFVKIGVVVALAGGILILLPPLQMPAVDAVHRRHRAALRRQGLSRSCSSRSRAARSADSTRSISSGTTPKMLEREVDARMIGYGAMLTRVARRGAGADRRVHRSTPGIYLRDQRAGRR